MSALHPGKLRVSDSLVASTRDKANVAVIDGRRRSSSSLFSLSSLYLNESQEMSIVREQINNAFANLGLAPAADANSKSSTTANGHSAAATISSADAIALEEQYSAHKSVSPL